MVENCALCDVVLKKESGDRRQETESMFVGSGEDGEMGSGGDGEMGSVGSVGSVGRWGDGEMGSKYIVVEGKVIPILHEVALNKR
ncbi:MAG: hypothetical protein F6K24_36990 [Okeania sp. SIO2D1]|nr:hypothetical protein [Okeania sp. SIO2D1]